MVWVVVANPAKRLVKAWTNPIVLSSSITKPWSTVNPLKAYTTP
jgi:hypothetical protein